MFFVLPFGFNPSERVPQGELPSSRAVALSGYLQKNIRRVQRRLIRVSPLDPIEKIVKLHSDTHLMPFPNLKGFGELNIGVVLAVREKCVSPKIPLIAASRQEHPLCGCGIRENIRWLDSALADLQSSSWIEAGVVNADP
jgi:hypothetical protein